MSRELPSWFQLIPGFKWFDNDGDLCIFLGWEPECEVFNGNSATTRVDGVTHTFCEVSHEPRMSFVYWYKNSWVKGDFDRIDFLDSSPVPDDHPVLKMLANKTTTRHMGKDSK